jgi:hypothetical protein
MGIALAGRKDLPKVSRVVGTQLGRVVGLLQGARARTDTFAATNELRQLQNELRSGLRDLDQVKTEFAVAASSQGVFGRKLGATVASANRVQATMPFTNPVASQVASSSPLSSVPTFQTSVSNQMASPSAYMETIKNLPRSAFNKGPADDAREEQIPQIAGQYLAPLAQTERAVIEEEWEKQGIGFRSRAEEGRWLGNRVDVKGTGGKTGSELLENLIKQNLIFDQYDRVVGEQEAATRQRIEDIKERRKDGGSTPAEEESKRSKKGKK